ncbi:MAG: hypothetical protein ACI4UN_09630 [Muribaculaceae bacterium]
MNFAKNILLLFLSPADAWDSIKKYSVPSGLMLSKVLYPLLAVVAVTAFAEMFYREEASLAYCIQKAIIDFAKFFFAYHICSYILTGFFDRIVNNKETANRVNVAIIYNFTILIILNIINNLLPTPWLFINIFYLYVFITCHKAAEFLGVKSNDIFLYLLAGLSIIVPFFIGYLLNISLSFTHAVA